MRVQGPECGKFTHLRSLPGNGRRIICLNCRARFRPEDEDDDGYDDRDRPARRRRGRREEEKPFPVLPVVAGARLAVTVTRIEFLDDDGKVITTVE